MVTGWQCLLCPSGESLHTHTHTRLHAIQTILPVAFSFIVLCLYPRDAFIFVHTESP